MQVPYLVRERSLEENHEMRAPATKLCPLYELIRSDLKQLFEKEPSIKEQIVSVDQER